MKNASRRWLIAAAVVGTTALAAPLAANAASGGTPGATTGPSSSDRPYLVRAVPGVTTTSILTTGDSIGGYRMTGIPDGLGAFDNGDGTFTVLMNHELPSNAGVPRDHGGIGAFVSEWTIDSSTLEVLEGKDLIQSVHLWNGTGYVETPGVVFNRFCSGDLAAPGAFYDAASGLGYDGRIYLNGEEASGGRAFGHVIETGDSFQLASFGTASWENVVANPATGQSTVVAGTSDSGGGAVYVYLGTKSATGTPVDRAGLTGGTRYGISVAGLATENPSLDWTAGDLPFALTTSVSTGFARPEDISWDPANPDDLYFVTTASATQHSRLWRAHFADLGNPAAGGTLSMLFEGPAGTAAGPKMMDNITVNNGRVLIQEDTGNDPYLAGIYQYDISSDTIGRIADHDPQRFVSGGAYFETVDEESSGIIPAPFLGKGAYLVDVQNHLAVSDPELVQKGQLLLLRVPPGKPVK
jgi:hypothetical protein